MWNKPNPSKQIVECLEREYEILKTGKFDDIAALSAKKETLLRGLDPKTLKPAAAQTIGQLANRNRSLMSEVMRALKDVSARIRSAEKPDRAFSSYTAVGGAVNIGANARGHSKKL
ncbi:hypothetical protein [Dinoroseobacter sp. S124A]|uniref:hypothetical protein n=1 Tax=Dinoroseobacter sp. S124A TaxID=3415128 RepID=UPI003C7A1F45